MTSPEEIARGLDLAEGCVLEYLATTALYVPEECPTFLAVVARLEARGLSSCTPLGYRQITPAGRTALARLEGSPHA